MILEAERTVIRQIEPKDLRDLLEIYSDEKIFEYEFQNSYEIDQVKHWMQDVIMSYNYEHNDMYEYGIVEKKSQKLIGIVSMTYIDPEQRVCEIGAWLNTKYTGLGYSTEIGLQLVDYIFKRGSEKIFCSTAFQNEKSWKLIERLGFEKEGHVKMAIWSKGKYFDEVFYGLMKSDYEKSKL